VSIHKLLLLLRIRFLERVSQSFARKVRQMFFDEFDHFSRKPDTHLPEKPARGRLQEPLLAVDVGGANVENDWNQPRVFAIALWRQLSNFK
jgi:hypothetical protein